ncbi:MAG: NTP transferase domain-containing protein [Gemmatimonadaceae bacterium]|nr:NTP transferase domain-containing protein [Chitinophagaceae bacterium]
MHITEAIILAGGEGTRLKNAVPDLPKCMAPVNARPFISFVIDYLLSQKIERFIFALGKGHQIITQYLNTQYATLDRHCVIENEPLGTGGAIRLACRETTADSVLVVNGDSLFKIDVSNLSILHKASAADCSIALKPMANTGRYGKVKMNAEGKIESFEEKKNTESGLVNGGVYILNVPEFLKLPFAGNFSFEKEFLESGNHRISGLVQDEYFIDIGTPEDFEKVQLELRHPTLP